MPIFSVCIFVYSLYTIALRISPCDFGSTSKRKPRPFRCFQSVEESKAVKKLFTQLTAAVAAGAAILLLLAISSHAQEPPTAKGNGKGAPIPAGPTPQL